MIEKEKKEIIDKLIDAVQVEAIFVKDNEHLSMRDKLLKTDVLLDIYHFLKDYEKNVKILNRYNAEHRWDGKERD